MTQVQSIKTELAPFSFMALLAGEGQVPATISASTDKEIFIVAVEDTVREIASDLTAKGDFFSLMVQNGQMMAEAPKKKYNIRIVRPTGLGGGFGGGFGGGNFGGGALAH